MNANEETVQTFVNANIDECPCGSGRIIIDCCIVRRANTLAPPPKTGYAHPRCYARELNDCDTTISREHYVSESVLEIISPDMATPLLAVPPFAHGRLQTIPPSALAPKILCKRHNAALGGLDQIGSTFFRYVMGKVVPSPILMINGEEIERWMLKALCGLLASGHTSAQPKHWRPPYEWLEILFGTRAISQRSGLYFLRGKDIIAPFSQVGIWGIPDSDNSINGLFFLIGGFQFLFFMDTPRSDLPARIFASGWQMRYRPECLVIIENSIQREIHFGAPPWGGFIVVKMDPSGDAKSS